MQIGYTPRPLNRTLAVIDGALNIKRHSDAATNQKPNLLDEVRQAIRTRHYSFRTEKRTYTGSRDSSSFRTNAIRRRWLKQSLHSSFRFSQRLSCQRVDPEPGVNALLFLYHQILGKEIG
jgi:hypothetical protein